MIGKLGRLGVGLAIGMRRQQDSREVCAIASPVAFFDRMDSSSRDRRVGVVRCLVVRASSLAGAREIDLRRDLPQQPTQLRVLLLQPSVLRLEHLPRVLLPLSGDGSGLAVSLLASGVLLLRLPRAGRVGEVGEEVAHPLPWRGGGRVGGEGR